MKPTKVTTILFKPKTTLKLKTKVKSGAYTDDADGD
jgi:hypothetical protein